VWIGWDPQHPAPLGVRPALGQWPHLLALFGEQVDWPAAQCAVQTAVGALVEPAVQLVLEVEVVGERAPGLKARLDVALQALDHALGLRVSRLAEVPAHPKLAAERCERVGRPAAASVQRALTVDHQRLRQAAQPADAAPQPGQDVGRLLGENQRRRARAREAQRRDDDPAATRLAMTDGDFPPRLPEIKLQQLTTAIDRALERARPRRIERAQLGHVVVDQRLAAVEAQLGDQLQHTDARQS
jgi:hypothetical protein